MNNKRPDLIVLYSIFALLLAASNVTLAQEDDQDVPAETAPAPEDPFAARVAGITAEIAEISRLESVEFPPGSGIQALLQRRKNERQAAAASQVVLLAEEVLARESETGVDQAQRDREVAWLELVIPWIEEQLNANSEQVVRRFSEQTSQTPSESASSTIEIDRMLSANVEAYKNYYKMLDLLEKFGVDVAERRANMTRRAREAAEYLAVAIRIDAEELQKLRYRLSLDPDDTDVQTLIKVADLRRGGYARNLGVLSDVLANLGIDPSQYRSLVLVVTGDVASRILDTGVMSTLAKQWGKAAWGWINANGLSMTVKILVFLLILFVFRQLSKLIRRAVEQGMSRVQLSFLLRNMIVSTAGNLVMAVGVLIALSQMGVSLGPLLAGLGVIGFIVGFALQDTLGNFASGMMILLYRPYDVGDLITAAGVTGKVKDMSLVYTMILTLDNQKMIVPNSKIWGDVIQNVTAQRVRRVDLVFGISYADDIEKAERILAEIVDANEMSLDDPEPMIKLHTLNESSVDFIVRPWVKSDDYWDVYWDVTREVKMRFDREGISIPFPQRDVHHYYDEAPPAPANS